MNERGAVLLAALTLVVIIAIGGTAMSVRQAQLANTRSNAALKKEYDLVRAHIASRLSCTKSLTDVSCTIASSPAKQTCNSGQINLIDERNPATISDDTILVRAPASKLTAVMEARACCSQGKLLVEVRRVDAAGRPLRDPLTKLIPVNQGTKTRTTGWVHLYPGALRNPPNNELSPCDLDKPQDIEYVAADIRGPNPISCISYYGQLGGWDEIYFGYQGAASCPAGYKAVGESVDCSKLTVLPWYESGGPQWHEGSYSYGANQLSTTTASGACCQSVNAVPMPPFLFYRDRLKVICQKG